MFEEVIIFYFINNIQPTPLTILYDLTQWFFMLSFALFLGLFIWSIILFIRERRQNPTSRKIFPRLLGFFSALFLSALCFALTVLIPWLNR